MFLLFLCFILQYKFRNWFFKKQKNRKFPSNAMYFIWYILNFTMLAHHYVPNLEWIYFESCKKYFFYDHKKESIWVMCVMLNLFLCISIFIITNLFSTVFPVFWCEEFTALIAQNIFFYFLFKNVFVISLRLSLKHHFPCVLDFF